MWEGGLMGCLHLDVERYGQDVQDHGDDGHPSEKHEPLTAPVIRVDFNIGLSQRHTQVAEGNDSGQNRDQTEEQLEKEE